MDINSETGKIQFNSMVKILDRLDKITYAINECRIKKDVRGMLDAVSDYYKEIYPDLTPEEERVWEEIKSLKIKARIHLPVNTEFLLSKLDEVDLKLRKAAKNHGYLTTNIKKLNSIINEMS